MNLSTSIGLGILSGNLKHRMMKIFFDFELEDDVKPPFLPGNPIFDILRSFLQTRYKILDDEINKECPLAFVVLSIDSEKGSLAIHKSGMSNSLSKRITGCVSTEDFEYLRILLLRRLDG